MNPAAKILIGVGLSIAAVGVILGLLSAFGFKFPLGRLPGDISIEKENVRIYFPLASSILVSGVLSLVLYLIRYFRG